MHEQPRFRAALDVEVLSDRFVFIFDDRSEAVLEGEIYAALVPLLRAGEPLENLLTQLSERFDVNAIYFALSQLDKRGYLTDASALEQLTRGARAFEEALLPAQASFDELPPLCVRIRTVGGIEHEHAARLLRSAGVQPQAAGSDPSAASDPASDPRSATPLLVVMTDDYLHPDLADINQQMLEQGRPWLLVKPNGVVPWVGPLIVPERTGCWACLAQRLGFNRQVEQYIRARRDEQHIVVTTSRVDAPALDQVVIGLLAVQLRRLLRASHLSALSSKPLVDPLLGRMHSLDLLRRGTREHVLVKRPQCRACGDAAYRQNDPARKIVLRPQTKGYRADGGHRTVTPSATYERLRHHVSPVLGAVTDLVPAIGTEHSPLTHSFVAGHNFSMGLESVAFLQESLRGMSGGKGASEMQAKVSGLCEALERYCGLYMGDEYSVQGSFERMRDQTDAAIHPNDCMGYSENQIAIRHEWNRTQPPSRCHLITDYLEHDRHVSWSPLQSLTGDGLRYLPTAYCYYGHPDFRQRKWCTPDSNGTAAGNTLEEAILQGFMELVERDAAAIWWYNRIRRQQLDLDSFELPYVDAIRDHYHRLGRDIWVLDISSDLQIPVYACVSRRRDHSTEDLVLGFGAHFDPAIALLRAITEVNQFLPSVSLSNEDGSTRYLFGDDLATHWWRTARLDEQRYLQPSDQPAIRRNEIRDRSDDDLEADVHSCVEICRENGFDLLVLDQTRPDIELAVAKVVVPQMSH
ncbi:MAG: TOMM precursor leader peptide-binding protein, partial [Gammaproteobacteria bacterium]|nr:TOMM precursor leader peptide-binding protein [Gammaproteobacteria bacterium]